MAALRRLSHSARSGLIQLCLSHAASAKPIQFLYPPSHFHSCNYGAGIFGFEFSQRPSFNLTPSYSISSGQNFFFSTSSGVADGSNSSSGRGKDRGSDRELKRTSETSWIDLYLPQKARPYAKLARLDKPIGIWLLTWPCMWSITMAAEPGNLPNVKIVALFACGALLLRGAGGRGEGQGVSVLHHFVLDDEEESYFQVERTKLRPVASGLLTPFQGLSFLGLQLLFGLGILLQLNNYSRILGASSLLLVFTYPLMKRLTFWVMGPPQAYLGLTFNWGALLGWAAVRGSLDPFVVFPLYVSGVFWTLVYDTIYAHQDKEDDLKVGVKSTALRFGDTTKEWLTGFGFACISSLALSGFKADLGWPYYMFLATASSQLAWQIYAVDLSNRTDCNRKCVCVQQVVWHSRLHWDFVRKIGIIAVVIEVV
ncbi:hypothetical protein Cgig2_016493 [Carnegiea gigantea]|uniref:4-hydroxybenzoate polyprenyltransferase, mitochondrial n=1 Tax=Carnegiea gigantea TaxID=171969 RepID=A0A9Q1GPV0_9CARY|nr:hypothetical protein Cgig2_016493 [Carnegiea gigantea]